MSVGKLTPVDLLGPNWNARSHGTFVVVRVRNEAATLAFAAKTFTVATRVPPGS